MSFFEALGDPANAFLRNALFAALIASVSFGTVGSLIVTRRMTYLTGALAHCVLGGIGFAVYARSAWQWEWLSPMGGALIAAILAAVILWAVERSAHQRRDTLISVIWTVGMAVGILFFTASKSYVDPLSYLFGDILLISGDSLGWIAVLDVVVLAAVIWCYRIFLALAFDEEGARLRGVPTAAFSLLLLVLTALTIVMLVSLVGIILAIALLTLPAAAAGRWTQRLWKMMVASVLLCMALTTGGIFLSYELDSMTGPTIILLAAAVWLFSAGAGRVLRKKVSATRASGNGP